MKNNIKTAIIIPYFGKFPKWIDLYLFSCSKNPYVDFLFFTDCKIPSQIYSNTIFFETTFQEYCKRVSLALGINFNPSSAYKLCDLKVFYGIIHKEELCNYTFWGFGDLDLIYGDMSSIINEKTLKRYNIITTHADRIAGHFTIVKKECKYTTICYKIKDWVNKLEDERLYGLDEHDFTTLVYPLQKQIWRLHRLISRFYNIHHYKLFGIFNALTNLFMDVKIKEYNTSPLPNNGEIWRYDIKANKLITPTNTEIPYLHFLFFKKTPFWDNENYWKDGFYQISNELLLNNGVVLIDNNKITYKDE